MIFPALGPGPHPPGAVSAANRSRRRRGTSGIRSGKEVRFRVAPLPRPVRLLSSASQRRTIAPA